MCMNIDGSNFKFLKGDLKTLFTDYFCLYYSSGREDGGK